MKFEDFQKRHLIEFSNMIESEMGKDLLVTLQASRPTLIPLQQEHLLIENSGAVRGYEQCIKNLLLLKTVIAPRKEITKLYNAEILAKEPPPFVPDFMKTKTEEPKP